MNRNLPISQASDSQLALPRSAVRQLAACAASSRLCPELELCDPLAVGFFEQLGGRYENFGVGELRCAAFRTSLVDALTQRFFERHPQGIGVALWSMLGTRAHRVNAPRWLDLDAPPLAALRERYLPPRTGWTQLASCLCSAGRAAMSEAEPGPRLFVLDESVLPLCPEALQRVLDSLSAYAPSGSELVCAFDAHACLTPTRSGTLELQPGGENQVSALYPRLRFVSHATYPEDLRTSLNGVNSVARLQGHTAPSIAHLHVV